MTQFNYTTFFDADDSLFNFPVKFSFLEYFLLETLPMESYARRAFEKYMRRNNRNSLKGASAIFLNQEYFKNFSGMPTKLLSEIGYSWYYKCKLELNHNFLNQKSLFEVAMHKRNQAKIVLVSRMFMPCLEPLIEELASNELICAQLEVVNGYYTGNILSDPITVDGKNIAIKNFLSHQESSPPHNRIRNPINVEENEVHFCDISYDYYVGAGSQRRLI